MGQSDPIETRFATVERGNPDRFFLRKPGLRDLEVVAAVFYDEMREARDHCKRQATEAGERLVEVQAREAALAKAGEELVEAVKAIIGIAAQMRGYDRAAAAIAAWDELMMDRYQEALRDG